MSNLIFKKSYSLGNIAATAQQFWEVVCNYGILAFSGDLGAGKTTFIHYICDYLEVNDTVSSPTFALINEYHFEDAGKTDRVIYHLDWYRLKDEAEAINAGMEDCIEQAKKGSAYCFIEWPEKGKGLLHPPYVWINITTTAPDERELSATVIEN